MSTKLRNLRAVLAISFACVVASACSVMPFQSDSNIDNNQANTEFAAADTAVDSTNSDAESSGFVREGEGAPGNTHDNPGGERTSSAGALGAGGVEDAVRGQNVGSDTDGSRDVFDNDRRRDIEYRWLKDRGVIAMQGGALDNAEKYFLRAIDLKPGSGTEDVVKLLDEVRMKLSKPTGMAATWEDIPAAAQEEFELDADRTAKRAKDYDRDEDWTNSIREYEKLRRLIRFAPYGAELNQNYEAMARTGIDKARTKLQIQRKKLEEDALLQNRRMRDIQDMAEEERRREEIVELWRQAVYNLELRRFMTAEEIIDRILFMDPQFRKAEDMKREIADRKLQQMTRDTFNGKIAGYQEAVRQLEAAMVAPSTTISYPTGLLAERIRARRAKAQDSIKIDPSIQRIQSILDSKVIPIGYEDVPLSEVIADIRRRAQVNIQLDPEVRDSSGEELVNKILNDLPLGSALRIILGDLDLDTAFRHGVLFVVGEDAEPDVSTVVTRVHDVRDLTFNITEFVGPTIRLKGQDDTTGGPSIIYPDDSERTFEDADRIVELVEESVAVDNWDAPYAVLVFGGQLVATHTPQVQAELRDFLDELRQIAGLMVNIEVRFISVEDDFLQDFGIDFRGNGGPANVPNQANTLLEDVTTGLEDMAGGQFDNGAGGIAPANPTSGIFFNNQDPNNPPVNFNQDVRGRFEHIFDNALGNVLSSTGGFSMQFAYFVDLTQINAVIHAVQKRKKARVLTAPRLTAFNTQRANITIVNQIPYVSDFELNSATSAAIANPVIDTILDGMVLDVKPTVSNDRRFVTIEIQPTIAQLLLPIPTFTTTLGPTSSVTLQIPEIKLQTVQTTVRVPDGGAVVIAGLKQVRDKYIESGVPILSDIPLLGMLFRRQGRSKEQFNLVIVVHAKIIDLNDEENRRPGWND
ncbi:MAG: type II and III secretion system protein [Planctomycetes bacterium]|nr:type II and III secretion system protein [Planctomycetota bacterium]